MSALRAGGRHTGARLPHSHGFKPGKWEECLLKYFKHRVTKAQSRGWPVWKQHYTKPGKDS